MTNGISEMVPAEESRGFARSAFVFCFRSCRYPPDGNERAIKVMLQDQRGTHGRDFWPVNADDSLIARSRQEDGERRVPWCSTVNHRANSHPDRNRSTIAALTAGVRLCQFATNSWSAALSRPISGRAPVTMS